MNWKGRGDYRDFKLKINSKDNTITIKKVKDSWTREEVDKLLELTKEHVKRHDDILWDEFKKENL